MIKNAHKTHLGNNFHNMPHHYRPGEMWLSKARNQWMRINLSRQWFGKIRLWATRCCDSTKLTITRSIAASCKFFLCFSPHIRQMRKIYMMTKLWCSCAISVHFIEKSHVYDQQVETQQKTTQREVLIK